MNTCLRVLRTSNGWVKRAERVPLMKPDMKEVLMGDNGGRGDEEETKKDLSNSNVPQ